MGIGETRHQDSPKHPEAGQEEKPFQPKKRAKCRFPIARIKKIMQSDEDIGKVSSSAPIVISQAIELFLTDLLELLVKEAAKKNSKKIVLSHVETCFADNSRLDFLKELIGKGIEEKKSEENK